MADMDRKTGNKLHNQLLLEEHDNMAEEMINSTYLMHQSFALDFTQPIWR